MVAEPAPDDFAVIAKNMDFGIDLTGAGVRKDGGECGAGGGEGAGPDRIEIADGLNAVALGLEGDRFGGGAMIPGKEKHHIDAVGEGVVKGRVENPCAIGADSPGPFIALVVACWAGPEAVAHHAAQGAEAAFLEDALDGVGRLPVNMLEADEALFAGLGFGGADGVDIGRGGGEGLFDEGVDTAVEAIEDHGAVPTDAGGDADPIQLVGMLCEHGLVVVVDRNIQVFKIGDGVWGILWIDDRDGGPAGEVLFDKKADAAEMGTGVAGDANKPDSREC